MPWQGAVNLDVGHRAHAEVVPEALEQAAAADVSLAGRAVSRLIGSPGWSSTHCCTCLNEQ